MGQVGVGTMEQDGVANGTGWCGTMERCGTTGQVGVAQWDRMVWHSETDRCGTVGQIGVAQWNGKVWHSGKG